MSTLLDRFFAVTLDVIEGYGPFSPRVLENIITFDGQRLYLDESTRPPKIHYYEPLETKPRTTRKLGYDEIDDDELRREILHALSSYLHLEFLDHVQQAFREAGREGELIVKEQYREISAGYISRFDLEDGRVIQMWTCVGRLPSLTYSQTGVYRDTYQMRRLMEIPLWVNEVVSRS